MAQLLNSAYADGRLTFDEHAERITKAYDAKTFGDLNGLTTDLIQLSSYQPSPAPSVPSAQPVYGAPDFPATRPTVGPVAATGFTGGSALLSTYRPGHIEHVAGTVSLNAWLGEVRADFSTATFAANDITIHIGGAMCEVKIRVPEGVTVDSSGLSMLLGEVKVDGVRPARDGQGVRLRLHGTVMMGEVKIIGPDARRNQFERFKP